MGGFSGVLNQLRLLNYEKGTIAAKHSRHNFKFIIAKLQVIKLPEKCEGESSVA
jgi:hypothetical protein